jgi:hypothetical protein
MILHVSLSPKFWLKQMIPSNSFFLVERRAFGKGCASRLNKVFYTIIVIFNIIF